MKTAYPAGSFFGLTMQFSGTAIVAAEGRFFAPSFRVAIMPTLNLLSGFGIVHSTSNTRLEGSAEGAIREMRPRNSTPGNASHVTACIDPISIEPTATSGTPNSAFTDRVSATLHPGMPGET